MVKLITATCGCLVKASKKNSIAEKMVCAGCSMLYCANHIYYYLDESNIAITKNAKPYCFDCYCNKYGNHDARARKITRGY